MEEQPQKHEDTKLDLANLLTNRIIGCAIEGAPDYRVDFLAEDLVIVEVKSVERLNPIFETQVITYLRLTRTRIGLLINFNSRLVRDGIKRIIV